ncbi:hypothetical protein D6D02_02912 [Aureobasidium pullulans]|nr:hypothetical protein D6D02_02912 [Aureobasidium pullulans]
MAAPRRLSSRIPICVDYMSKDQPSSCPQQKPLPKIPSPSKPHYMRLSHSVLDTIYESSLDEREARELAETRWSIRPVKQDEGEDDVFTNKKSPTQVEEDQESLKSKNSSISSQHEISLTSTNPTSLCNSQVSDRSVSTDDYKEAYQQYRLISLQSRKVTAATCLHVTIDKTQFLINQLHVSMTPLNLLNTIIGAFSGSAATLNDLREQGVTEKSFIDNKTEEIRAAIRDLLNSNHSLIRECEVLLKENNDNDKPDLFIRERLAVNRLITTIASKENVKVDADENLQCQQETLATFNDYVAGLVQGLGAQNVELERLIGDVNQRVCRLEQDIDAFVRDKRSLSKLFRKMFYPGRQ